MEAQQRHQVTNARPRSSKSGRRRPIQKRAKCKHWPALGLAVGLTLAALVAQQVGAQFLFTYEINSESDDSRAPKSSLFDPSSFKIVTPAQLQSTYNRLAAASQAPEVPAEPAALQPQPLPQAQLQPPQQVTSTEQPATASFLKQTSAALQSFAELFQLAPSSSPSPLGAAAQSQSQVAAPAAANLQPRAQPQVDQQAEARSLHEHWTRQQQRAHQQPVGLAAQSALQSFGAQPSATPSTAAGAHQQGQQAPPAASYWLTASPLNPPDGNFLVEVKQQQQQQQQESAGSVVEKLLLLSQAQQQQQQPVGPLAATQRPAEPAQSSFLSGAPAAFFPGPSSASAQPPSGVQQQQRAPQPVAPLAAGQQSQALHTHQARSLQPRPPRPVSAVLPPGSVAQESSKQQQQQLRPPANEPEHFALAPASNSGAQWRQQQQQHSEGQPQLKSAEESLLAFRQAQQAQHEQQDALLAVQQAARQAHEREPGAPQQPSGEGQAVALGAPRERVRLPPQPSEEARSSPKTDTNLGSIPKVSPQIYESFLLQQKDQFEKHMELLKQQQELNRLLEQKQKQQEQSAKQQQQQQAEKRRKKEQLERLEERKRQAAKLEQEQAEMQKKRRQEEEAAAAAKRYREQLLAEKQERELREAAAKRAAAKELEERLARERREQQEAKLRGYLRQQEELRKLLELKQKEEEEAARRHHQAPTSSVGERTLSAAAEAQQRPQPTRSVGGAQQRLQASRLALEHRERAAGSALRATTGWGAPLRAARARQETESGTPAPSAVSSPSTTGAPPVQSSTIGTVRRPKQVARGELLRRKQKVADDEKLIRQKIPLYSGAGKYGLYRGSLTNDTTLAELAALLDSVTLPSSTTTSNTSTTSTTSTTTSTTPAPMERTSDSASQQPSLSFDDDDVPRRPTRTAAPLVSSVQRAVQQPAQPKAHALVARPALHSGRGGGGKATAHIGLASLPPDADNDGIPGRAGIEYPVLGEVPRTSFSCSKQPLNGYYADTETACQVVHLCQAGVQSSILCPNGTIFNQEKFSCQWWYEVNCSRAPMFYQLNDNLYKALPAADRLKQQRQAGGQSEPSINNNNHDDDGDDQRATSEPNSSGGLHVGLSGRPVSANNL